jgi:hypothetical protein
MQRFPPFLRGRKAPLFIMVFRLYPSQRPMAGCLEPLRSLLIPLVAQKAMATLLPRTGRGLVLFGMSVRATYARLAPQKRADGVSIRFGFLIQFALWTTWSPIFVRFYHSCRVFMRRSFHMARRRSNLSLQLIAGRSAASHYVLKTHSLQPTLALASGS